MDAINLLPVKPMDAGQPRARTDAAPDQAASGFSFENLLDERNAPAAYPPPMEAEEQGTEAPVETSELPAGEDGAEVSTLVAMLSTLPPPLPPPIPREATTTAFVEDAPLGADDATPSVPVAESPISTSAGGPTPNPRGQLNATPPKRERKEAAAVENKVPRAMAPVAAQPRTATAPVEQTIPADEAAAASETAVPNREPAVATREAAAIPPSEPILNPAALPANYAVAVPVPLPVPVTVAAVASGRSQPAPVAAPAIRRTTGRGETFNSAAPSVEPNAVARETETSPVGRIAAPLDGEFIARELPETKLAPALPAALDGEPFTRDIPIHAQRPLTETRGAGPRAADAVVAKIPDGVEIAVVGTGRRAAPAAAPAVTPIAERTPETTPVRPADAVVAPNSPPATRPERAAAAPIKNPVPISVDGTSTATQERVMPDSFQPRVPEPKTAGPAAKFNAAEPATPTVGARTDGHSPFQNRPDADARQEEKSAFQQQPGEVAAPVPTFANPFTTPARATTEPVAITRTDVETIVHRTVEAAERLRVTGGERVEVHIRLDAGQELTVRLHFTNGEVKPVFLTESQDLRRAIEQNWAQFSERTSDRTTRVTTPIFESPNAQSGMNDLNQRQREGRERTFSQAQAEAFAAANAPGRGAPRRPNVSGPTLTAPAGLQLYA